MSHIEENPNGNEKRSNLLVLPPAKEGRFAHTVTQEDLIELQLLSREFSEARERWEKKRDWIKAALRAGACVQDGVLTAKLVKRKGGGYNVEVYDYEQIIVR